MSGAVARMLPDGQRLHLQHGPIDLVIGVDGPGRAAALAAAAIRFRGILQALVDELPLLRAPPSARRPTGATARRMHRAVAPHAKTCFVTPMAAVAGAVADEILAAMTAVGDIERAFVNNGGDIALHLAKGATFQLAMAGLDYGDLGQITVTEGQNIGGIATSGQGGRSLSRGIAQSVTVLGASAAAADVAATLIANAVDLPGHRAIWRARACDIDPDSDLGQRDVVVACEKMHAGEVARALDSGLALARKMQHARLIHSAALFLQDQCQLLSMPLENPTRKLPVYA